MTGNAGDEQETAEPDVLQAIRDATRVRRRRMMRSVHGAVVYVDAADPTRAMIQVGNVMVDATLAAPLD